jgi:2-keto-4-pentenoate hydratase/2-oxohepta-3-ene-1,7-dioic acid hydratase in catechol pathway
MRWARVQHEDVAVYGHVEDDGVHLVDGTPFGSTSDNGVVLDISGIEWLPPVIPPTFYCVGLNYRPHIEMHAAMHGIEPVFPTQPDVGYRAANALVGHQHAIIVPPDATEAVQYEGELVCVVGHEARHLTEDNALDCLLGYTIGNDVSERSWQKSDRTLWRAKNADTFKPMGPWIETSIDLEAARTRVLVNGVEQIDFATNNMIFGVVDYLVAISRYMTLVPGDVLWMGTDGHAENLVDGDEVSIKITGIGELTNRVEYRPG